MCGKLREVRLSVLIKYLSLVYRSMIYSYLERKEDFFRLVTFLSIHLSLRKKTRIHRDRKGFCYDGFN